MRECSALLGFGWFRKLHEDRNTKRRQTFVLFDLRSEGGANASYGALISVMCMWGAAVPRQQRANQLSLLRLLFWGRSDSYRTRVFKWVYERGGGACLNFPVLHPSPLAFFSMCTLESPQPGLPGTGSLVDGPIGRQGERERELHLLQRSSAHFVSGGMWPGECAVGRII